MHFKWVNCMVCEFYLNKTIIKKVYLTLRELGHLGQGVT